MFTVQSRFSFCTGSLVSDSPCLVVMSVAVFFGGESDVFFKGLDKVALRGERKVIGNVNQTIVGVSEKVFCLLYFFLADIVADGNAEILFKETRQVAWRQRCVHGKLIDGNALVNMAVDIVCTLHNRF